MRGCPGHRSSTSIVEAFVRLQHFTLDDSLTKSFMARAVSVHLQQGFQQLKANKHESRGRVHTQHATRLAAGQLTAGRVCMSVVVVTGHWITSAILSAYLQLQHHSLVYVQVAACASAALALCCRGLLSLCCRSALCLCCIGLSTGLS